MKINKIYTLNPTKQTKNRFSISLNQLFFNSKTLTLLVLLAFGISSCTSTRHTLPSTEERNNWKIIKIISEENREWTIYSQEVTGSKFLAFKLEGEVNMTPILAVKAMREEIENSKAYLDEKEGFTKVLSSSKEELISYSVFQMPFPFKDRAMLEKYTFSNDEKTGVHKVTWKEDWNATSKETKGVIRVPINQGYWEFIPMERNKSKAIYMVLNDPGGKIPAKFVNPAIIKELPKKLRSLEKISAKLN
jgi:hypothetical protein